MNKFLLFIVSSLLSYSNHCSAQSRSANEQPACSNPLITKQDKDIDAVTRQYLKHRKTVGVEIGVLKSGKITFYGYGETGRGNRQLPDEHTIFEIGSLTKTFAATLLALAVNEGKLKLDDAASKYLPDSVPALEYQGVPVTLQTLANHTSGIPSMPANFLFTDEIRGVWTGDPFKDYDDNDLFSFYTHFKLKHKPGEKNRYSNLGFATLGVILERVYGKPFEKLVVEKICDPLGMSDTRQTISPADTSRIAHGYAADGQPALAWHDKAFAAAGALRSTASDLLRYAQAGMGAAPAPLKTAMALTHQITFKQKHDGDLGLAWNIYEQGSNRWIGHGGTTGGFGCILLFDPQRNIVVAILSNNPLGQDDLATSIILAITKDEK